jgi:hypothetical protein
VRERLVNVWKWMHAHRRRWVPPVILLFAFVALHDWTSHAPRELDIELPIGEGHERVKQVDVAYLESDELVHHVSLRYPSGAPDAVRHQVELAPGHYVVSVDLIREDGVTESRQGTFEAPAEGRLRVRLREGT